MTDDHITSTESDVERGERPPSRYLEPGWTTTHVVNPLIAGLTRWGLSVRGSRVLAVRGRTTGEWRTTPVNVLTLDGERYLVAPRGVTQWVRNVRVAGGCDLRVGRRTESVRTEELADGDKAPILRSYLARWKSEVGVFFDGIGPDATDDELLEIAPGYPVFRLATP